MVFESGANFNGTNPNGNPEIFLFDTTNGMFSQITFSLGVAQNNARPEINADGTRIAFQSRANLNGVDPDGATNVFLFDTTTELFNQITNETGLGNDSTVPSIDAEGTRIAFQSNADIQGGNPDGTDEVSLAVCFDPAAKNIPTMSEWGLIAMAGILGIIGIMVLRRRKVTA